MSYCGTLWRSIIFAKPGASSIVKAIGGILKTIVRSLLAKGGEEIDTGSYGGNEGYGVGFSCSHGVFIHMRVR